MPSLPVTPVDLEFYALGGRCGEMIIEMELAFAGPLDEHRLAAALDLLLDAEPVLGCRLVVEAPEPRWEPVERSHRRCLVFTYLAEEYEAIRRCGLDATANVQLSLCLWRGDPEDRLLIKVTHEAGDGASLQGLVSGLAGIYSALGRDPGYEPPPNRDARRDFHQITAAVPKRAYAGIVWDFARFMAPRWLPRATQRLPFPQESVGPWIPVIKELPAMQFGPLSGYAKARGATLNDVFLAAAYRALAACSDWDGTSALRIPITVDLRRWCLPDDRPRAVSNLSSLEFPLLIRDLGRTFDETLANVTVLTRRRKREWPGLAVALLKHALTPTPRGLPRRGAGDTRSANAKHVTSVWADVSLVLSNEGALDGAGLCFDGTGPVAARILPPFLTLPGVHVCVSSYRRALTFAAVTPHSGAGVLDRFLSALVDQLPLDGRDLDAYVRRGGAGVHETIVDAGRGC